MHDVIGVTDDRTREDPVKAAPVIDGLLLSVLICLFAISGTSPEGKTGAAPRDPRCGKGYSASCSQRFITIADGQQWKPSLVSPMWPKPGQGVVIGHDRDLVGGHYVTVSPVTSAACFGSES